MEFNPPPETVMHVGDFLVVLGQAKNLRELARRLGTDAGRALTYPVERARPDATSAEAVPKVRAPAELMNAARVAAASVDGWLNDEQGAALFDAAAGCSGRGAIVEIGSWKGRSTIWLAHGARLAGQPLFAVDPHVHSREDPSARTLDEFSENIRRAGGRRCGYDRW